MTAAASTVLVVVALIACGVGWWAMVTEGVRTQFGHAWRARGAAGRRAAAGPIGARGLDASSAR